MGVETITEWSRRASSFYICTWYWS